MRRVTFLSVGLLVLFLVGFTGIVSGEGKKKEGKKKAANFMGTWASVAKAPNGMVFRYQIKLKQKGNKITGVVVDPIGGKKGLKILKGKVKGRKITFYHYGKVEGQKYKASYEGKLGRSGIKGQIEVELGDEGDFLPWTATRVKAKKTKEKKK